MASSRRIGREGSETRRRVLDAVEELMIESGHAATTYRAVAARAGVTPSLVQYYFPSLDELLVATVRRRSEQSLRHVVKLLQSHPGQPLRALWEFSNDETDAALTIEFSALGNHRDSVRAEITDHTNRLREIQLEALAPSGERHDAEAGALHPAAVLFLLSGIPKMLRMEEGFDVFVGHGEIVDLVDRYLESEEPRAAVDGAEPGTDRRK